MGYFLKYKSLQIKTLHKFTFFRATFRAGKYFGWDESVDFFILFRRSINVSVGLGSKGVTTILNATQNSVIKAKHIKSTNKTYVSS